MKTLKTLLLVFLTVGLVNTTFAQNDSCAIATPITGPGMIMGDTLVGGGASNIGGTGATNANWYTFTAPVSGLMSVYSCDQGIDTRVTIFDGSCGTLNQVGFNDDACSMGPGLSNYASRVDNVPITMGTTYYIEWDDRWSASAFNWTLEAKTCVDPSGLDTANATSTSIDMLWTVNSMTSAGVTVEYGPAGFVPGTGAGTVVNNATSPLSVSGLSSGTLYEFYVQDSCGVAGPTDVSGWVGYSFFLPGACNQTAPYFHSFELGGSLDPCWAQSTSDQMDWIVQTGTTPSFGTGPSSGAYDGSYYVFIETSFSATGDSAVLITPTVDVSTLSAPSVSFWYHMFGSAMGSLDVDVDDGSGWTNVWSLSGDQGDMWHRAKIDLGAFGSNVTVRFTAVDGTSFTGDVSLDAINFDEFCDPVSLTPYVQDFEGSICESNDTSDTFDWTLTSGSTPSGSTGPTGAYDGANYLYIETSAPRLDGDSAIFVTKPIAVGALTYPELTFGYHMWGAHIGELRVEMMNAGSGMWMPIWSLTGDQGNQWEEGRVNLQLAGAADTASFRFIGVVGGTASSGGASWQSDIAIDGISIAEGTAADIAATGYLSSLPSCGAGNVPVTIEISNFGFLEATDFDVFFEANGSLILETITDTLAPDATMTYTFNTGANLTMPGSYIIDAGVIPPAGDADAFNDEVSEEALVLGSESANGYATSWEMDDAGWVGTLDFQRGIPAGAVINGAPDGMNAWVTNLTGDYTDAGSLNEAAVFSLLYSPCFDFGSYTSDPMVSFDLYYDIEDDWDGAWMEFSTDGGLSWTKYGSVGEPGTTNWYNTNVTNQPIGDVWNGSGAAGSGGWIPASAVLTGLAGEPSVQFRYVLFSDALTVNEGLGIDNFMLSSSCPDDLGIAITPFPETGMGNMDGGAAVAVSNGVAPYSFAWSNGDSSSVVNTLSGNTVYYVTVTDANGCSQTDSVSLSIVSTEDISSLNDIKLFPNPTADDAQLILSFENAVDVQVELMDVMGRVLATEMQSNTTNANFSFDVSKQPAGMYLLRITADGQSMARRLMVTK